jgi:aminoglycoside phosphotransferase (APT) family kinase protein
MSPNVSARTSTTMRFTDEREPTAADVGRVLRIYYSVTPRAIEALSSGYSNVWRVTSPIGHTYVFSIFRANKTVDDVRTELQVLGELRACDTGGMIIPTPVRRPHMATRVSYVRFRRHLACLYKWIPHEPYDGSLVQGISAVYGCRRVQRALLSVSRPRTIRQLAVLRGAISSTPWNFRRFLPFVKRERWARQYVNTIAACENGVEWIRNIEHQLHSYLHSQPVSVIHYDPSPGNFGFNNEGNAICLLDFDQAKWGWPAYDLAWNVWSFAAWPHNDATHKHLSVTCDRLRALTLAAAPELGTLQPTLLRFYLLTRVLLTLHGRLTDTFINGFANLRFMEAKLSAVKTLVDHARLVENALGN